MTDHAPATPEKLYTYQDIADMAQVSRRSVQAWVKNGRLRVVKLGGHRRVTAQDWAEFLTDNR